MEHQGEVAERTVLVEPPLRAKTPVFGHEPLGGYYRTKLESNGRLVIPAALRAPYVELGSARVLVVDTTLWVLTLRAFELNVEEVVAENSDLLPDDYRGMLYHAAIEASVDKQARLVIPPDHRRQVGFDGEIDIVVAGSVDHLEIWGAASWDAEHGEQVRQAGLVFKGRKTLPTGGV